MQAASNNLRGLSLASALRLRFRFVRIVEAHFTEVMLQQLGGQPTLLRIVYEAMFDELLPFVGQRIGYVGRFAHADLEHDLEVRIELTPRALRNRTEPSYNCNAFDW